MGNFVLHGTSKFLYDGKLVTSLNYEGIFDSDRSKNIDPIKAVGFALSAIDCVEHGNVKAQSVVVSGIHLNGFGIGGEVYSPRESRPLFFGQFASFQDYQKTFDRLTEYGLNPTSDITLHGDYVRHLRFVGSNENHYGLYSSFGPMNGREGIARVYLAIADAIKSSNIYEKRYLKKK